MEPCSIRRQTEEAYNVGHGVMRRLFAAQVVHEDDQRVPEIRAVG